MKDNKVDQTEASPGLVIRANRKVRAVAIAAWIVSTLAGALLIRWMLPHSEQYLSRQGPQGALRTIQIVLAFMFLSLVPLGAYLFWFGCRAVRWRQIPPPGTWVVRDTQVIEGEPAQRRGWIVIALAILLSALGLSSAIYFPYRLGKVFHGGIPESTTQSTEPPKAH